MWRPLKEHKCQTQDTVHLGSSLHDPSVKKKILSENDGGLTNVQHGKLYFHNNTFYSVISKIRVNLDFLYNLQVDAATSTAYHIIVNYLKIIIPIKASEMSCIIIFHFNIIRGKFSLILETME